jgi:Fe-S-cluster containining protein
MKILDTSKKNKVTAGVKRLSFPSDEKLHPWLTKLLEAYYNVDSDVATAIELEKNKNRKLACHKGCSNCCKTHQDVPVYPLELVGISWYVTEKISGAERETLKSQLEKHKGNNACPFLFKDLCAVHPVRPISCRQFTVFGKPCAEGEDPYYTRRQDVMLAVFTENSPSPEIVRMQDCNWSSLSRKMADFDKKKLDQRRKH